MANHPDHQERRMNPTTDNPIGVETYDHRNIAALPEYEQAARALDQLAHAINRADLADGGQQRWLQTIQQIATSLPYGDCCKAHGECTCMGEADGVHYPYQVKVEPDGRWLHAAYRCHHCGNNWATGWAVDLPDLGP
jgi:hypothetical protein